MSAPKTSLFFYSSSASEGRITPVTNSSSEGPIPEGCVTRDLFHFIPWDNEENLVSKEVENVFKLSIYGIAVPLLFVVSFVTNTINMVVFYKHGLKERINACLFTLSLVDLLSVSITYAYSCDIVYMFVIGEGGELGSAAQFFIRNRLMGLWGLVTSSHMVYAVIAVERCLCITRPLLVKSFMSTRTTVAALLAMILTITGVHMFLAGVRYTVKCLFDVEDRSITYASYPSEFYYRHQFVMDLMYSFISGLFFPGLAFLSVTVCTVVTAVKLKKLSRWRESVSSASGSVQSRDLAITRVIIGTSVLFIVCILPGVVLRSSFLVVPKLKVGGRYDNLAWVTIRIYILASLVNSTFNFFVYYTHGSKFRETVHRLFPLCCHGEFANSKTVSSVSYVSEEKR